MLFLNFLCIFVKDEEKKKIKEKKLKLEMHNLQEFKDDDEVIYLLFVSKSNCFLKCIMFKINIYLWNAVIVVCYKVCLICKPVLDNCWCY